MKKDPTDILRQQHLHPQLSAKSLDLFLVRQAILKALTFSLQSPQGTILDVGCGHKPYKTLLTNPPSRITQYIGLDILGNTYSPPDVYWDGEFMPLQQACIDCAIATEVLEHVPHPEIIMTEVYRVLKPGGLFFFTVPFLWPLHDVPYDEYRYTPFALKRHLHSAGFAQIRLKALGGWDASLAQMLSLWVRRRPMSERRREVLSRLALPIIRCLVARDRVPQVFGEGMMITGLSGTAIKPISQQCLQT